MTNNDRLIKRITLNEDCAKDLVTREGFSTNCKEIFKDIFLSVDGIDEKKNRELAQESYLREIRLLEIINNIIKVDKKVAYQFTTAIEDKDSFYTILKKIVSVKIKLIF